MDSRQIFVLIVMASAVVVFLGVIMFNVFNIHWEVKDSRKRLFDYLDANMKARKHLDKIMYDNGRITEKPSKKYIMDNLPDLIKDHVISVGWRMTATPIDPKYRTVGATKIMEIYITDNSTNESELIHTAIYDERKERWEVRELE